MGQAPCAPYAGVGKRFDQSFCESGAAARIGAIERQWPGFPAKPDHGAPLLHDGVLFGQEHASSPFTRTASINAGAGSLPKPANALGGCSSTYEICHIRQTSAETNVRGTKVFPALNALKNARIRRPFRCN